MNLNSEELSKVSEKKENALSSRETKSFDVNLNPLMFTNEDTSPNSHEINQFNESFFVKLCLKCRKKESFLPLTNSEADIYKKTLNCQKAFILIMIIGMLTIIDSLCYMFDLKENSQKFFYIFLLGSTLITISLTLAKGSQGFFIFLLKNNILSIIFTYVFNWTFLYFFALKAKSSIFSCVFAISQVIFFFIICKICKILDYGDALFI